MKLTTATMIFDTPAGPWDSDYHDGRYYAVTLEVPPGTPGAEENNEFDRHQIRTTFPEGGEMEKFWRSLSRGDEVQIAIEESAKARSGYTYKPVVPDDWEPPETPQQATKSYESSGDGYNKESYTSSRPRTSPDIDWLNPDDVDAVVFVGKHILKAINQLVSEARQMGYDDLEAQKIGVTAYIESTKHVKKYGARSFAPATEAVADNNQEEAIIRGIDPSGLPDSFLNACAIASPYIEDRNEATAILKSYGFSGANLDPDDEESWVYLYAVARAHAYAIKEEGATPDEATKRVTETFDINREPF